MKYETPIGCSIENVMAALDYIPARPDYETWIEIISAIGNTFSESEALGILESKFANEKPNEIRIKLKNRLKKHTIGTLFFHAKKHGYTGNLYNPCSKNTNPAATPQKRPVKAYKYTGDTLYTPQGERLYRTAFNPFVVNKTKDMAAYNAGFINITATLREVLGLIKQGFAICNCQLIEHRIEDYLIHLYQISEGVQSETARIVRERADNISRFLQQSELAKQTFRDGCELITYRVNNYFTGSELVAIDIDNGLSIKEFINNPHAQKHCKAIYTSCSHTAEQNRYRALFELPELIKDPAIVRHLITKLISKYGADSACKAAAQGFYGNTNAEIFIFNNAEKAVQYVA